MPRRWSRLALVTLAGTSGCRVTGGDAAGAGASSPSGPAGWWTSTGARSGGTR